MSPPLRISLGVLLAFASLPTQAGEPAPRDAEVYGAWSFYNNMGWGAYYRGDLDLARHRFTNAIEYIRPYQQKYPKLMARSCHDLTRVLCAQGKFSDAEPMAKWVVEARDHDPLTRDDVLFDSVYVLAFVYRQTGRDADAVPHLRRAVALEEKHFGIGDARIALTLKELADCEVKSGALAEADDHYRRAIAIHKRYSSMNLDLADALAGRAGVLEKLGQTSLARRLNAEADMLHDEFEGLPRLDDHMKTPLAARTVRPEVR